MKDELRNIVEDSSSQLSGMNKAREYLQSRILLLMMEAGAMIPLAFCGGTALRFLYRLPRFSEDLDFSMEKLMDDGGFGSMMDRVRRGLVRQGYDITVKNRKVSAADWPAIRRDIAPFLENPSEAEYLNRSDMVQALSDSSTF